LAFTAAVRSIVFSGLYGSSSVPTSMVLHHLESLGEAPPEFADGGDDPSFKTAWAEAESGESVAKGDKTTVQHHYPSALPWLVASKHPSHPETTCIRLPPHRPPLLHRTWLLRTLQSPQRLLSGPRMILRQTCFRPSHLCPSKPDSARPQRRTPRRVRFISSKPTTAW
jgi:hypothetical protein